MSDAFSKQNNKAGSIYAHAGATASVYIAACSSRLRPGSANAGQHVFIPHSASLVVRAPGG